MSTKHFNPAADMFDQTGDRFMDEELESPSPRQAKVIGISIYGTIKIETPKAYLLILATPSGKHDTGDEIWVPKSQCLELPDDTDLHAEHVCIILSDWIAKEKGLASVSSHTYHMDNPNET